MPIYKVVVRIEEIATFVFANTEKEAAKASKESPEWRGGRPVRIEVVKSLRQVPREWRGELPWGKDVNSEGRWRERSVAKILRDERKPKRRSR